MHAYGHVIQRHTDSDNDRLCDVLSNTTAVLYHPSNGNGELHARFWLALAVISFG
jgi:hypothetical protein